MIQRPDMATITILVDNKASGSRRSEHGFSAWFEVARRRLLFDTGQGPALEGNAGEIGVDLRTTDTLVLSHGHFDHTGGLPLVVERAPDVQVCAHPLATGPRFVIRGGSAKPVGMPDAARVALESIPAGSVHWITDAVEIAPGVGLTGPIPRLTEYEDTGGPFFVDDGGRQSDPITDDLALWIRTDRGLVVLVGCSHAGVINTLRHARTVSGEPRLHAVLGGFHLTEASPSRLQRTIDALEEFGLGLIVPCHCTGDAAVERLRQALGDRVVPGSAGTTHTFGRGREHTTGRTA